MTGVQTCALPISRVFEMLRSHHLPYWQVFLTTSVLYLIGTFSYLGLIRAVERREVEEVSMGGTDVSSVV